MNKRSKAVWEYNKENTVQVALRLNKNTDEDIIKWLNNQENKQGYIKYLIREDIELSSHIANTIFNCVSDIDNI